MKSLITALLLAVLVAGAAQAQDAKKTAPAKAKVKTEKVQAADKAALNKTCLVTGEDVDPEVTYTYNGTTYAFCCANCIKKFKKDPEKYINAAAKKKFDACEDKDAKKDAKHEMKNGAANEAPAKVDEAVINTGKDLSSEIVNTVCPVMNDPVDKKVTTVSYKGKVYGFCCKACIKKFAKDPEKYLKQS